MRNNKIPDNGEQNVEMSENKWSGRIRDVWKWIVWGQNLRERERWRTEMEWEHTHKNIIQATIRMNGWKNNRKNGWDRFE